MDMPTLLREIRALDPADLRTVMDVLQDSLGEDGQPFQVPDSHRQLIAERIRAREADPSRGEPWDVVRQDLRWDA
ncbi:MAG TPA: addiction module protein [Gemmataceae bacterium]|nr:addiction module protein [Gemmataceae bacterium]